MKIVRKISYGLAASIAVAPMTVLAQFQTPAGTGLPAGSIVGIVTSAMNWLLIIVGILGVIGFVIAGIIYLTAAGDEEQIEKGEKTEEKRRTTTTLMDIRKMRIDVWSGMFFSNLIIYISIFI